MTSQTNTSKCQAFLTVCHRPLLFSSRSRGFVCACCICCVKWLKMKEWSSLEKQVFSTHYWQCPIWCGRAAATTDSLPTGEQTLAERLTRKNGMGWELGNEWGRYYPRQNNKVKTCVETEKHAAQTAWSWDFKISHGSTSQDQISEAWVQRNLMEAKGRNINRLLRLIDWFDIFLPAWTFLTVS